MGVSRIHSFIYSFLHSLFISSFSLSASALSRHWLSKHRPSVQGSAGDVRGAGMVLDLGKSSWKMRISFSSRKRKFSQGKTTSPGAHGSQGPVARRREALDPENLHWSPHGLGWTGPQVWAADGQRRVSTKLLYSRRKGTSWRPPAGLVLTAQIPLTLPVSLDVRCRVSHLQDKETKHERGRAVS